MTIKCRFVSAAPTGEQYEISSGKHRAVVAEVGAALRSFTFDGRDLVHGFDVMETIKGGRGQNLIPWPNRIRDGRYTFNGVTQQLALTEPARHNASHGLARYVPWVLVERQADTVVNRVRIHPQPGWPGTLEATITHRVGEEGLMVTVEATNLGDNELPFGYGAHPYLTVGGATVDSAILRVPAGRVLRTDERGLPVGSLAVAGTDDDFTRPRRIGRTRLDHAFTDLERGPDGLARAELQAFRASRGLTLWVDEAYAYLMVFTGDPLPDVNRRSIAIEPMTCPPNAFRTGDGVIRLEPGESFRSVWGITPP